MKKLLGKLLLKYKLFVFSVLAPLGIWGAALVGFVDSGTLPVPMDLIMTTYIWNDRRHAAWYVLLAAAGSALGGLIPFFLGRAGGEIFLLRRVDRVRYEQLMARFEKQEFLAMAVPSMLPPPTPWKLFAFGAGVFEMRVASFMLAVFIGRLVRFGVEAVLTVKYGPRIVEMGGELFQRHLLATMIALGSLLALLVLWALRKLLDKRRGQAELARTAP